MRSNAVSRGPFLGRIGWLVHRVVASYWALPLLGVLAAIPAALALLALDRAGLGAWMLANDLDPVATADTAKDLLGVAVGVNAAFITLYFSLTLLVLTLAGSNLGVRLIDRWLDKRLVRVSLTGLSFTLMFSLAALAAIDGEADKADLPVALVAAVIGLQAINVAMLTVALHDLGRTIFVDRAIEELGYDLAEPSHAVVPGAAGEREFALVVAAPREGYVEGNDLAALRRCLGEDAGRVRVCAAPGQHVLKGEPILMVERATRDESGHGKLCNAIPIGGFRSDGQGAVFRVRLLVEIAARALSPAINDFYTAIACADRLAAALVGQRGIWIDAGKVPLYADDTDFELPGQDLRGLFDDPLSAFRQSACQYPSVAIRMIDNYARAARIVASENLSGELHGFLRDHAAALADHAASQATFASDREDIRAALAEGFPAG